MAMIAMSDPSEFMFPGAEFVDGSIVGAMKAGMKTYEFYRQVAHEVP